MRVVIKPRGLVALLTLLFILIALPFVIARRNSRSAPPPPPPAPRSTPAATAAGKPATAAADGNLVREENWRFYTERTARAFQEKVPDPPAGSASAAYRFSVEQTGGQDWNVGFNNKLRGVTLGAGDRLRLRFRARSSSRSTLVLLLQRDVAPYPHSWKEYVRLEPGWKPYEYVFPVGAAYADGEGLMAFFMGMNVGKIDLADIQLERA